MMNVVAYGGGTNSTAMLIGMQERGIPADVILFADTGAERPETYEYIQTFEKWLRSHGMPAITWLEYFDESGTRLSLETESLKSGTLPSIAYGYKRCSLKHKRGVQDKFCNGNKEMREIWNAGGRVNKFIGYDAGEPERRERAFAYDISDKKYKNLYPLIDDWGWGREECKAAIKGEGLPLPGKSSCFFCPSMKKAEIRDLYLNHRDLFDRAVAIERNAKEGFKTVKGLGRNWSWEEFIAAEESQISMFDDGIGIPCNCFDG